MRETLCVAAPSRLTVWRIAILIPFVVGALAWLWTDVTLSTAACARDDRGGTIVIAGLIVLIVVAPMLTAWSAWRSRHLAARAAAAIVASAALAAILVWVAYLVWWFGHDCYS